MEGVKHKENKDNYNEIGQNSSCTKMGCEQVIIDITGIETTKDRCYRPVPPPTKTPSCYPL